MVPNGCILYSPEMNSFRNEPQPSEPANCCITATEQLKYSCYRETDGKKHIHGNRTKLRTTCIACYSFLLPKKMGWKNGDRTRARKKKLLTKLVALLYLHCIAPAVTEKANKNFFFLGSFIRFSVAKKNAAFNQWKCTK